jgi:hypothetical protein
MMTAVSLFAMLCAAHCCMYLRLFGEAIGLRWETPMPVVPVPTSPTLDDLHTFAGQLELVFRYLARPNIDSPACFPAAHDSPPHVTARHGKCA